MLCAEVATHTSYIDEVNDLMSDCRAGAVARAAGNAIFLCLAKHKAQPNESHPTLRTREPEGEFTFVYLYDSSSVCDSASTLPPSSLT